jgi:Uma2 family endonuclease
VRDGGKQYQAVPPHPGPHGEGINTDLAEDQLIRKTKYDLYQSFGVQEYWILYPLDQTLLVYKRGADGLYGADDQYAGDDQVPVPLLGDLVIDLAELFAE